MTLHAGQEQRCRTCEHDGGGGGLEIGIGTHTMPETDGQWGPAG